MSQSEKKHISFAYIPPPPGQKKCAVSGESPRPGTAATVPSTGKEEEPPMPAWNCFDIPKPSACKPPKCPAPPVPKPFCSSVIIQPTIHCPPIQRPPICPIQISIQHGLTAGSCSNSDTLERESNTISITSDGKTMVLCSEGYERKAKYMTRKDTKGLTHTYCKEFETRSNMAKGSGGTGKSCKPSISTKRLELGSESDEG